MRRVWRGEGVPRDWRKAIIVPIFKKGNVEDVQNYSSIIDINTNITGLRIISTSTLCRICTKLQNVLDK